MENLNLARLSLGEVKQGLTLIDETFHEASTPPSIEVDPPNLFFGIETPWEIRFKIAYRLPWRDIEQLGRTCKQAVSEMRHNGLWVAKVQELRRFRREVDANDRITLATLRREQSLLVDYVLGLRLDRLIVWLGFATSEMLTSFTHHDEPTDPFPPFLRAKSKPEAEPEPEPEDEDPMDIDAADDASDEPVAMNYNNQVIEIDDSGNDDSDDIEEDDGDDDDGNEADDENENAEVTEESQRVRIRRYYEQLRDMESLDFEMAPIDEKTKDVKAVLRSNLINDDIPRQIDVQSIAFSKLIARAFTNAVSPVIQPDSKNCRPSSKDPTCIIMGMDEKKPHYAIRMPLRSILTDHTCIWRSVVRLCWIDHMRERQMIIAYENIEMFYNKKLRNQLALEVMDGVLSTNAIKEPHSITTYPSMVTPPTTEQIKLFELRSPGCSFYCSVCGKLLGAGDSEDFTQPHTSSLVPIFNQTARFCSTRCLSVSLQVKDRNTVRCCNDSCGAKIGFASALGSRCDFRIRHTFESQPRSDPTDVTSPMNNKFSVKLGSAEFKAFSDEIYSALAETEAIIDHSVNMWRAMVPVVDKYNLYSSMICRPSEVLPRICSIFDAHALKTLLMSYHTIEGLLRVYKLDGSEMWNRRFDRLEIFRQKLWKEFNFYLGIDRQSNRAADPRGFMFTQDCTPDILRADDTRVRLRGPTVKPIIEFGQCLPFATLGLGLPIVREFSQAPFLTVHGGKYGSSNAWDHTDPRAPSSDAMRIASTLKYDAYCSSSCMRGDKNTTRCMNLKCNAVLDTTAAIVTLECMELLFITPLGDDQAKTTLLGYVCDEYCAEAYMAAKAVELAKKRKARQEHQREEQKEGSPKKGRLDHS